jgi:hypothetical protein
MPANHPLLMLYESLNAATGLSAPADTEPCDSEAMEFSLSAQVEPHSKARVVLFSQPTDPGTSPPEGEPALTYVVIVLTKLHACVYLGAPELAYRVWFGTGTSEQQAAWTEDLARQRLVMRDEAVTRYGAQLPNAKHCACTQKAMDVQRASAQQQTNGLKDDRSKTS